MILKIVCKHNIFLFVVVCFGLNLVVSCVSHHPKRWEQAGLIPTENQAVELKNTHHSPLKMIYTGAGGVVIEFANHEAILTDPFYSNASLTQVGLGKIASKPDNITHAFNAIRQAGIDPTHIKGILVAHTHYDHLLDLPYIYANKLIDSTKIKIMGSKSTKNVIQKFVNPTRIHTIEDSAYYHYGQKNRQYGWYYISPNIRILPIEAQHAPHFKVLGLRIKLYKGEVCKAGIRGFETPTSATKATHWREGGTFSFLIDYIENQAIKTRIFIQTSSCKHDFGFPPAAEITKRGIDIAVLGVASANMVRPQTYPQNLVRYLKPETIVLVHWENFFQPYLRNFTPKTTRTVALTNFNRFFKHLQTANDSIKAPIFMPRPGTVFKTQ